MGNDRYNDLTSRGLAIPLEASRTTLYGYSSDKPLHEAGEFTASIGIRDQRVDAKFIVLRTNGQLLLGRRSAEQLGVLSLNPVSVNTVTSNEQFRAEIRSRYAPLFQGVGKLKDYEAKIHTDS